MCILTVWLRESNISLTTSVFMSMSWAIRDSSGFVFKANAMLTSVASVDNAPVIETDASSFGTIIFPVCQCNPQLSATDVENDSNIADNFRRNPKINKLKSVLEASTSVPNSRLNFITSLGPG